MNSEVGNTYVYIDLAQGGAGYHKLVAGFYLYAGCIRALMLALTVWWFRSS